MTKEQAEAKGRYFMRTMHRVAYVYRLKSYNAWHMTSTSHDEEAGLRERVQSTYAMPIENWQRVEALLNIIHG